jgi:hypothetical protein
VVFVHADAVEAHLLGIFELVEILVIGDVTELGLVQAVGQVDPHRTMLLTEVVRHVRPGHQMEPGEFHRVTPSSSHPPTLVLLLPRHTGEAGRGKASPEMSEGQRS